jgi:hypothetical protein
MANVSGYRRKVGATADSGRQFKHVAPKAEPAATWSPGRLMQPSVRLAGCRRNSLLAGTRHQILVPISGMGSSMRAKRFLVLLIAPLAAGSLTFVSGVGAQAVAAPPSSAAHTAQTAGTLVPQSRADYKRGYSDGRYDARNCEDYSPSSRNSDYRRGYNAGYYAYYDESEC